jgi:hypothetical protein
MRCCPCGRRRVRFFSKAGEHLATNNYSYDKIDRVEHYLLHEESPPRNKTFVPAFQATCGR